MNRHIAAFSASVAFAIVLLAGCGGGYGSDSSSEGAAGAAGVSVTNSQLGRVVADGSGRTLYLFEKDQNGRSACYAQCTGYWPPLLTRGGPVARAGATQSLLGTTRRTDGSEQVTYAGHPVYRFAGDTSAGQTGGEGSEEFGGRWDALSPAGTEIDGDD